MYDQAKAARHRIFMATVHGGEAADLYVKLADILMQQRDADRKIAALRRLADSCEAAMAMLSKNRQPGRNRPGNSGYLGKPSS